MLSDTIGVCAWCLCLVEEDPSCLFEGREGLVVEAGIEDVYNKSGRFRTET